MLVLCEAPAATTLVAARVSRLCGKPFRVSVVPGDLSLPTDRRGTLVLYDVSALTLSQQITLYDWMNDRSGSVQVFSITSTPLLPLVNSGRFLEGLYYRMNVVYLVAALESRGEVR
ncbi:MAG: hypothetical protein ACM3SQ_06015 [Betaproteobacteria bacterium]